jgi:hypothetical protein
LPADLAQSGGRLLAIDPLRLLKDINVELSEPYRPMALRR